MMLEMEAAVLCGLSPNWKQSGISITGKTRATPKPTNARGFEEKRRLKMSRVLLKCLMCTIIVAVTIMLHDVNCFIQLRLTVTRF